VDVKAAQRKPQSNWKNIWRATL